MGVKAGWGGTARLGNGSRLAVPQLRDSQAFIRGPTADAVAMD